MRKFNGRHGLDTFNRAYMQIIKEQAEENKLPAETTDTTEAPAENEENLTTITFKTADPTIIDIFNSGFASATFNVNVKAEDGEGEEETKPVDVDGTLISGIEVIPPENGEACPTCGNSPCTCGGGEDDDEVTEEEEITECGDTTVTEDEEITEEDEDEE